jgi:predicted PurR-regulated permease PerM
MRPDKSRRARQTSSTAPSPAKAVTPATPDPNSVQSGVPGAGVVDSPPWSPITKAIMAVVALVSLALILWHFNALIRPLVIAAILAYLLNPLITLLIRRLHVSRGMAVTVVYLAFLLVVLSGAVGLGFVAFDQVTRVINLLPDSMTEVVDAAQRVINTLLQRVTEITGYDVTGLAGQLNLSMIAREARAWLQPALSRSGLLAAQFASSAINLVTTGLLIFIVSFYMAKDSPQFGEAIREVARQPGYGHDAERLMREFLKIWDAYLRGQVVLGIVIGIVVSVSLSLLGVSNALGLGLLAGVLEFLPVIGPFISAVAAVLVALFQDANLLGLHPLQYALVVLLVMILIQQVENSFLVPRIVGDALDLHPLVVMISVVMGASLAGILGAILAAPVAASLKLFGAYAWRKMLDLPPFSEPEPPPKPKRGKSGLVGQWRLWRMKTAGRFKKSGKKTGNKHDQATDISPHV